MSDVQQQQEQDALERVILDDDQTMFKHVNKTVAVQPKHVLLAVQQAVSYALMQQLFDALDKKYRNDKVIEAAWEEAVARGEEEELRIVGTWLAQA